MCGLRTDKTAQVIIAGHAFMQNLRRGHYELAADVQSALRVAAALLVWKPPTADLETLSPGKLDEDALAIALEDIDDFLEGKPVPDAVGEAISNRFHLTEHKRQLPITPHG